MVVCLLEMRVSAVEGKISDRISHQKEAQCLQTHQSTQRTSKGIPSFQNISISRSYYLLSDNVEYIAFHSVRKCF